MVTDDIVTRLREGCDTVCKYATVNEFEPCEMCDAADEIERLRERITDQSDTISRLVCKIESQRADLEIATKWNDNYKLEIERLRERLS